MELEINTKTTTPVYEQIVQQIKTGIVNGELKPGAGLPAIRALALALGFNQNTVAKAYRILEQQQVTSNNGRKGTRIHANALNNIAKENHRMAEAKLDGIIASFEKDGLSHQEIAVLLRGKIETLKQ